MLFMFMISMMLTYQPFFIGGIDDLEQAKRNANGGVGSFLTVFIVSVVYLVIDALWGGCNKNNSNNNGVTSRRSNGNLYDAVPTSGVGGPDVMLETRNFSGSSEGQFT